MTIIPAILTHQKTEFRALLALVRAMKVDCAQIDLMDGQFVPSRSLLPREFFYEDFGDLKLEMHLMAQFEASQDLIASLKVFAPAKRIIVHQESCQTLEQLRQLVNQVKDLGKEVSIALNPQTDIRQIGKMVKKIDGVQFMGVMPGYYGAQIQTGVYQKVREFRQRYSLYQGDIAWDGGVTVDNIQIIRDLGVNRIAIGSAIFRTEDPVRSYQDLLDLVSQM